MTIIPFGILDGRIQSKLPVEYIRLLSYFIDVFWSFLFNCHFSDTAPEINGFLVEITLVQVTSLFPESNFSSFSKWGFFKILVVIFVWLRVDFISKF